MLKGYYTYNGVAYKASSPKQGSNMKKCRTLAKKALKIKAPCKHNKCTFGGIWNGGGGVGFKNLYASSFFYDYAAMVQTFYLSNFFFPKNMPQSDIKIVFLCICTGWYNWP